MLHVLYIIINISCQKSGNVIQPLTGPFVYGVNRSDNFSFCQIYFLCEEGVPEADINV